MFFFVNNSKRSTFLQQSIVSSKYRRFFLNLDRFQFFIHTHYFVTRAQSSNMTKYYQRFAFFKIIEKLIIATFSNIFETRFIHHKSTRTSSHFLYIVRDFNIKNDLNFMYFKQLIEKIVTFNFVELIIISINNRDEIENAFLIKILFRNYITQMHDFYQTSKHNSTRFYILEEKVNKKYINLCFCFDKFLY